MPKRRGHSLGRRRRGAGRRAAFPLLLASLALLAACAAPNQPTPPAEPEPVPVADLTAHQAGTAVVLHFTLPHHDSTGSPLPGPPRIEIRTETADAVPSTKTLEASDLAPYRTGDEITFSEALAPEEFQAERGKRVTFRVRVAAGESAWSPESNAASIRLVEPPLPPNGLAVTAGDDGVTVRWSGPSGGAGPAPTDYIVYRSVMPPQGSAVPARPVGVTAETTFRDTDVQAGVRYRYTVRSVNSVSGGQVESADSSPVEIQFTGTGAPAAPTGLVAVALSPPAGSLEVDLSWAIGGERNLAGYNIYRGEQPGERGNRINQQLVVASAFRDTTVAPGRSYRYSVTAVDLAGNESPPSKSVPVTTPALDAGVP